MNFPKAKGFVVDLIGRLCPTCDVDVFYQPDRMSFGFGLKPRNGDPFYVLFFDGIMLDNLEEILKDESHTKKDEVFKEGIRFRVYVGLGKADFIPDFRISQEIVNERRVQQTVADRNTSFDEDTVALILSGLKKLENFLSPIIQSNSDLENIEVLPEDLERIRGFIDFYKRNDHFNSPGVTTKSTSLIKAALVAEIIEKENRKAGQSLKDVKAAIDKDMYSLVEFIRRDFSNVPLPDWFREDYYQKHAWKSADTQTHWAPKGEVFLSSTCRNLEDLRLELVDWVGNQSKEAIKLVHSEDVSFPKGSTKPACDICLDRVKTSNAYVLVVDKLEGTFYKGADTRFHGLTVTHAELLTALDKEIPVYTFIREHVLAQYKQTKANPQFEPSYQKGVQLVLKEIEDRKLWRSEFKTVVDLKKAVLKALQEGLKSSS